MENILLSFILLAFSSYLVRLLIRMSKKPVYMMEIAEFSRSALMIEKGFKMSITFVWAAICAAWSIFLFIEEFSRMGQL